MENIRERTITGFWLKSKVVLAVMITYMDALHGKVNDKIKYNEFCPVISEVWSSYNELKVT